MSNHVTGRMSRLLGMQNRQNDGRKAACLKFHAESYLIHGILRVFHRVHNILSLPTVRTLPDCAPR